MPYQVYYEHHSFGEFETNYTLTEVKQRLSSKLGISATDIYATHNGKIVSNKFCPEEQDVVRFHTRLVGGKGGFGSMLRAIGAQIEKTTNREACRDLSGRRLRDINEEKRLRKWLDGQAEREREALERKQKKLEKLVAEPNIEVDLSNTSYEKERLQIPERVSAAVDVGWQAASTSEGVKRKAQENDCKGKKKKKLWIDAELSDCSSLSEDEDDDVGPKSSPGPAVSTDSGNESDRASEISNKI
ncbi:Replication stress response regulator SDE2 [Eumeta japonica]|uniref:Replication stress response regulator SDE2 n=1 Tax=Eumeta variegata TaxID=151549 RepID=A0A4C1ZLW2_EUMVA|nr:Replication stress response regulator SDE2 [Eumeta japonica]